jgi:hypothetical protein
VVLEDGGDLRLVQAGDSLLDLVDGSVVGDEDSQTSERLKRTHETSVREETGDSRSSVGRDGREGGGEVDDLKKG